MPAPKLDIVPDESYGLFLAERRRGIVSRLAVACSRAGRDVSEVGMLAVSKMVEPEAVRCAWRAGWRAFAENRPQELGRKLSFVESEATPEMATARFDLIGNLQKNKINQVIGKVELLHSVSSAELARAVSSRCEAHGLVQACLLEVNVSGEQSKSGFAPDEVRAFAEEACALPGISIEGLMTMAPRGDADAARATFSGLRELAGDLRTRTGFALPTLSCGMSDDFQIAVEEGSTLVRLGRVVFDPEYDFF
ncbi:YggS family pyridoxal phosphate-dependent enzyme [Paratractidigestivibacter sp.]|uniref:YggS family pyridoxal phosphate-dependent enzyme n=1 Tax=Paratractidigestivibacter sp. TaxID=2847316 RepID=UPI002AC8976F|nr:YggS family pyridoxal phosphate-dependent enzyme [Paratractidigestivibacter sp.]